MQDYYKTLGVSKDADEKEIKKAFRSLAMKYHPDRNEDPKAEDKFKRVNEAYNVLSDPEKRSNYDRFGTAEPGSSGFEGFSDIFGGGGNFGGFNPFSDLFGGRGGQRRSNKGSDIRYTQNVPIENIFN